MSIKQTIQQLRDAYKKGTQGEWKRGSGHPLNEGIVYRRPENMKGSQDGFVTYSAEDAEAIVLSHNLLPSLLDSYEEMEREMEKMREALERHGQHDLSCGVKHFIRWQHLDGKCETRTGECSCGLEAALSEAEAK